MIDSWINAEPEYVRLQARVQEIASTLLDELTIPAVRAQQELLDKLAGDEWWQDVTLPMLETMRRRIRSLAKLIERPSAASSTPTSKTSSASYQPRPCEVWRSALISHDSSEGAHLPAYPRKQLAVQKIRRNRQITTTDLDELERIFIESRIGTEAEINHLDWDEDSSLHYMIGFERLLELWVQPLKRTNLGSSRLSRSTLLDDRPGPCSPLKRGLHAIPSSVARPRRVDVCLMDALRAHPRSGPHDRVVLKELPCAIPVPLQTFLPNVYNFRSRVPGRHGMSAAPRGPPATCLA